MSRESDARVEIAAVFKTQIVNGDPFPSGAINGHLGPGTSCGDTLILMSCVESLGTRLNPKIGRNVPFWELIYDPMSEKYLAELRADVEHYKTYGSGHVLAHPGACAGCHYNQSGTVGCPQQEEFTAKRFEMLTEISSS